MTTARLRVEDPSGTREEAVRGPVMTIGRRSECSLRLFGSDVSRLHADITVDGEHYILRDRASSFGTFVNGMQVTEHELMHGDTIRLGQSPDCQIVFLLDGEPTQAGSRASSAAGDIRHVASLLSGLRALGSGRVLDDVLTMVIDAAIEVAGAERGFIMLADPDGSLVFRVGRGRGRVPLPGRTFETSRKVPEEVFETGGSRFVEDLRDDGLADGHAGTVELGIRQVLCVPLVLIRYVEQAEADHGQQRIGVLYLDSRERGSLHSHATRSALETLAAEAAVAIQNARLYREAAEKTRLEQELRIAAEIQQSLMPRGEREGGFFEVAGASIPCRAIGGDFFDYVDLGKGRFGVALGDVSGKGAPAALLTALVQGMFTVEAGDAAGPAGTLGRINRGLKSRDIESRFVTMFYGVLSEDGTLTYCNGGHNPPVLLGREGVRRLEAGGMILGIFEFASFGQDTLALHPGDTLVVYSDGISEAQSPDGEEFGDERLIACLEAHRGASASVMREAVLASVRVFSAGTAQGDDMTLLVVRYAGS